MKVFKFGGASVKDHHGVINLFKIIKLLKVENTLIVVSAMGKTTNAFEKVVNAYFNDLDQLRKEEEDYNLKDKSTFINFQQKITEIKNVTNAFVDKIIQSKETVLGLGASTKGNILLQHFGLDKSKIPFRSERNSEKVGLKCLGSDIELISEETARSMNPSAFIVLPWNFKDEIVKREKEYINNGGQLMFPMPYPHVVTKRAEIKL